MFIFSTGMRENEAKRVSFRDLLKLERNQLALQNYKLCFISFVWLTVQLVVPQFGKTPSTIAYAILRKNLMTICVSKCITIMFVQCTLYSVQYLELLNISRPYFGPYYQPLLCACYSECRLNLYIYIIRICII